MNEQNRPQDAHDLDSLADRLRKTRPEMSALELDSVRSRAMAAPRPSGTPLRSRLAVALALLAGVFACTSGAALAVSAVSDTESAAERQYGVDEECDPDVKDCSGVGSADGGPGGIRADEQAVSGRAQGLPFSGFVAIPLLAVGLLLLATGIMMVRRLSASP